MEERDAYWKSITIIEARETIRELDVSMAPHISDDGRKKLFEKYRKQAYPLKDVSTKKLTNKELFEIMKRR